MQISLTPDQQAWLTAHVERGEFASIDAAALQHIDERIAERMIEEDGLAWARPLVEKAQADIAAGSMVTAVERDMRLCGQFRIKPRTGIGGCQWKRKSDTTQFQRPIFQ